VPHAYVSVAETLLQTAWQKGRPGEHEGERGMRYIYKSVHSGWVNTYAANYQKYEDVGL